MKIATFSKEDFAQFYQWLCLDEDAITWQGKYHNDFHNFWNLFFLNDISLGQVISRFSYVFEKVKTGPLRSWFKWMQNKFIIYCFIYKKISIGEISEQSDIYPSKIATLIRDFYVDRYPLLMDSLNECFELGNISDTSLEMNVELFKEKLLAMEKMAEKKPNETMTSLEITLYPEWRTLLQKMKKDFSSQSLNGEKIKKKISSYAYIKFLQEVFLLFMVAVLIIFTLRWANKFYDNYLAEKIKILEPEFLWLNKDLSFKDETQQQIEKKEIINELSALEKMISKEQANRVDKEERFETESDVVISSINSTSYHFGFGDTGQSQYEESQKGVGFNFRSYRFGHNWVYRIIVKSVRPDLVKKRFADLLEKYDVTQADKVLPGKEVPGGLYYNLYVPHQYLKEFIAQVARDDEATLYETKTRSKNPLGKNRVFIFVKSI